MSRKKALVTLAVGNHLSKFWNRVCRANWEKYAIKNGYDLIAITEPLDTSERAGTRSAAWQKCLILGDERVQNYEQVVWLDADILINSAIAPCIVSQVERERVGAVEAWSHPSRPLFNEINRRELEYWGEHALPDQTPEEYYVSNGFSRTFDKVVQTGVLVLSPAHHRKILEHVYYNYEDKGKPFYHYEMRPLSYELLCNEAVQWLDGRFNQIWYHDIFLNYPFLVTGGTALKPRLLTRCINKVKRRLNLPVTEPSNEFRRACLNSSYNNAYFLHFAGGLLEDMKLINTELTSWRQIKLNASTRN